MLFCFVASFVLFSSPFFGMVFLYTRVRLHDEEPLFLDEEAGTVPATEVQVSFILDDTDLLCFGNL
jgi:hypothetical protein